MNPGALENAAARGTFVHNAVENWIRGLRVEPPREYFPYWEGMPERLTELLSDGKVLWSEKPYNQPQWSRYTGEDGVGRIHYYDEITGYGYAGCCDIIYIDGNGEVILGDFKTSAGPYSFRFPKAGVLMEDKLRKALISGVFKLKKTQLQLAAYKKAAESCLGIKIDKTQIIVSTPVPEFSVQVFTFGKNDIEKHEEQWMEVVKKFYNLQAHP
jgi:hypothetical protein